jgi:hypothetical protein
VRDEAYYTESELVDGKAPTGRSAGVKPRTMCAVPRYIVCNTVVDDDQISTAWSTTFV